MVSRDDFPAAMKESLAKRAGYKCSCPWCGVSTIGPSSESVRSVSSIGIAAHITAAAPGGPRYNPTVSALDRQSIQNGVWLCQNHAKLVDDDESRFTVDLLRGWRQRAETIASYVIAGMGPYDDGDEVKGASRWRWRDSVIESHDVTDGRLLVPHSVSFEYVANQDLHRRVYEFLRDVGVTAGWGREAGHLTRLLMYEIALNGFQHAGATSITLSSEDNLVSVLYKGARFGFRDLDTSDGRGGKAAMDAFQEATRGALALNYRWHRGLSEWYISDLVDDGGVSNLCGIQFGEARQFMVSHETAHRLSGCEEIHIYPPEFFSFSDARILSEEMTSALPDRPLVMHGVDPESRLGMYIQEKMPSITLIY